MTTPNNKNGKSILEQIARRVMLEHGFLPDFSLVVLDELAKIQQVNGGTAPAIKDLRHLLWASIDNDDSLDLDQLTASETLPDNNVKIFVAIADVDALVKKNSEIDGHAHQNTTSVYTAGKTFPMLPEKLSNGLCSLRPDEDRLAFTVFMNVSPRGSIKEYEIVESVIRSKQRFSYERVQELIDRLEEVRAAVPSDAPFADVLWQM